jgi:hypothetical protein
MIRLAVCPLAVLFCALQPGFTQQPADVKPLSPEEVDRRLRQPVSMDFKDVPLKKALDDLRGLGALNIIIDQPALDEDGCSLDRPVACRLEGASFKTVLEVLTHQVGLTTVMVNDVIVVTTEAGANPTLVESTYPVSDLIFTPEYESDRGACVAAESVQSLIRLIEAIAPASWTGAGGKGTIEIHQDEKTLRIVQTADIQGQVPVLLEFLRLTGEFGPYQAGAAGGVVATHIVEGPWERLPFVPKWNRTVLPED